MLKDNRPHPVRQTRIPLENRFSFDKVMGVWSWSDLGVNIYWL